MNRFIKSVFVCLLFINTAQAGLVEYCAQAVDVQDLLKTVSIHQDNPARMRVRENPYWSGFKEGFSEGIIPGVAFAVVLLSGKVLVRKLTDLKSSMANKQSQKLASKKVS